MREKCGIKVRKPEERAARKAVAGSVVLTNNRKMNLYAPSVDHHGTQTTFPRTSAVVNLERSV